MDRLRCDTDSLYLENIPSADISQWAHKIIILPIGNLQRFLYTAPVLTYLRLGY